MKYAGHKYNAPQSLEGLIEYIYAISIPEFEAPQLYHIAPNLERMIVFNFGSSYQCATGTRGMEEVVDTVTIMGPIRQMFSCLLKPGCDLLVCCFVNDGFYRLTSAMPPPEIIPKLHSLWLDMKKLPSNRHRIDLLSKYLLSATVAPDVGILPLVATIPEIHHSNLNPVEVIASKGVVSTRTVQMRFKKYTGYSSKELLRFLRFKQLIGWLVENYAVEVNWMSLVWQFGYHDQSHMTKDFKHFTGLPPNKILNLCRQGSICLSRNYLEYTRQ